MKRMLQIWGQGFIALFLATSVSFMGLYLTNKEAAAQLVNRVTGPGTLDSAGSSQVNTDGQKRTYHVAVQNYSQVGAMTQDVFNLAGAAGKIVRLERVSVSGRGTAISGIDVSLVMRSTANPSTSAVAVTAVPSDASDTAASATAGWYYSSVAANQLSAVGAAVGTIRTAQLTLNNLTTGLGGGPLVWDFGYRGGAKSPLLRTAAQNIGLYISAVTGMVLDIDMEYTEE